MEFWHLLLFVGMLGAGLAWSLGYLLRYWARANSAKVEARRARFRQAMANAVRRLRPPKRARNNRATAHDAELPQTPGGRSDAVLTPRSRVRETPRERHAAGFGTARHEDASSNDESVDEAPALPPVPSENETVSGLPGLDAVRSDVRATADEALGNLTALFDRLEHGDLPIEDFLKAAALEREETERQMRCLEVLYSDDAALRQDEAYQQAQANCRAVIKCQQWALEFRESLRHAHA